MAYSEDSYYPPGSGIDFYYLVPRLAIAGGTPPYYFTSYSISFIVGGTTYTCTQTAPTSPYSSITDCAPSGGSGYYALPFAWRQGITGSWSTRPCTTGIVLPPPFVRNNSYVFTLTWTVRDSTSPTPLTISGSGNYTATFTGWSFNVCA